MVCWVIPVVVKKTSHISHEALVLVLPISQVWKLQIPYRRKLGICGVFLLGSFVVGVGIVRVVYHVQLTRPNSEIAVDPTCKPRSSLPFYQTGETLAKCSVTDAWAAVTYWTVVEACIGVVSACLPTLRPLVSGELSIWNMRRKVTLPYWRTHDHTDATIVGRPSTSETASHTNLIPVSMPQRSPRKENMSGVTHLEDVSFHVEV